MDFNINIVAEGAVILASNTPRDTTNEDSEKYIYDSIIIGVYFGDSNLFQSIHQFVY